MSRQNESKTPLRTKLRMVWAIMQGRTVVYRATIHGGLVLPRRACLIENRILGPGAAGRMAAR